MVIDGSPQAAVVNAWGAA